MRFSNILLSSWLAVSLALSSGDVDIKNIQRRQGSSAAPLPTLGSNNSPSASVTASSVSGNTNSQSGRPATNTNSAFPSQSESGSARVTATHNGGNNTSSASQTSSSSTILPASTAPAVTNSTSAAGSAAQNELPIQPRITPGLSIGGVVLLLTGVVYALIGVKNRWVHIFLSTAYLTSLSITVLIVYVLNPPVSNAIQGAYFVGIFMTGVIFGAGALIFKEVTEGLGCLLGGFCLSMWFLTLKEGGLITTTGGKAIFISAFCVVAWSLSFSHYTRAYGLMGSIAFSGATAFVLGIDCFSRGGLKEFWLYIWDLNDNIFPLNTNTYPITRGTRVETIVIVLATIVGVISQMKLWKIVKDRQNKKNEEQQEESRRRDAVEAALGRHLERQNDRDRSEWEKQYGDRLNAKRETILWTDAHGEKGYSKIRESEVGDSQHSASSESLEMKNMSRKPRSMYVTRIQRNSVPVSSIPEVEEGDGNGKAKERQKVLEQLEGKEGHPAAGTVSNQSPTPNASPRLGDDTGGPSATRSEMSPEQIQRSSKRQSKDTETHKEDDSKRSSDLEKYLSANPDKKDKKRRSFVSYLSRSAKGDDDLHSASQSQEALVVPETSLHHSRASSLAATLDFENENLEFPTIDTDIAESQRTPEIVISPVGTASKSGYLQSRTSVREIPPSEPELEEEQFDVDPEEFVRPAAGERRQVDEDRRMSSGPSSTTKRQSGSEVGTDLFAEDAAKSRAATSETSQSEILTKGALELMPSQLSHVVMSYRTNEWAKHISTAEAPLFEEPEPIGEEQEVEPPTHLADPTTPLESKRSSLNQPPPPEISVPVPSALPSPTEGIRINPAIQPEQTISSATVQPMPTARIRSTSESSKAPRGLRSTSTPMLVKQALQTAPIDENVAVDFATRQSQLRSASAVSLHQQYMATSPPMNRPSTTLSNYGGVARSNSRLSLVSEHGVVPPRSVSQLSNYQQMNMHQPTPYQQQPYQQVPYIQQIPSRSETRMQSYDSHQPLRRNTSVENQRREVMFADWRVGQHKVPSQQEQAESHRQQMLMERQQLKMMEEQEKNFKWQQEMAIDARMRGRDMQELHREAMRKMQAGANKKI